MPQRIDHRPPDRIKNYRRTRHSKYLGKTNQELMELLRKGDVDTTPQHELRHMLVFCVQAIQASIAPATSPSDPTPGGPAEAEGEPEPELTTT